MMKKKKLIVLGVVLITVLTSFSYGVYLYNKPAMQVENQDAVFLTTSKQLVGSFTVDATKMTEEYIGKVIEVKGKVSLIESSNGSTIAILDDVIKCEFKGAEATFKKGQEVVVKGIFSGYDDMFNELSFVKCVAVN